ncbi:MAG: hypothetical protein PHD21_05510, partial [Flavobacteriales bacterium]|nr:hypothetical protein [Flavobacteriales bacterium]
MKNIAKTIACILTALLPITAMSQQMTTSFGVQNEEFSSLQIDFPQGKSTLMVDYKDNAKALKTISANINNNIGRLNRAEYIISVVSEVIITDNEQKASRLAKKRALTLKSYLIKKVGAEEKYFITTVRAGENGTVG